MSGTDIFLSYARQDRPTARLFAQCLVEDGFSVWWDASLRSGETFDEVIERNLREAGAVVVLWSPASVASRWVRAEATLADRRDKLAPAIIEPCDRPIIFELTHAAELSGWAGDTSDQRWRTFVADLRRLVERNEAKAAADGPGPAPASAPRGEDEDAHWPSEVHCLQMMESATGEGLIAIDRSGVKFGRAAPADIVLEDRSISREHCIISLANDELLVTDLNSTNGTFVDDVRISRATILPLGSVLRLGQLSMKHVVRTRAAAGGPMPDDGSGGVLLEAAPLATVA